MYLDGLLEGYIATHLVYPPNIISLAIFSPRHFLERDTCTILSVIRHSDTIHLSTYTEKLVRYGNNNAFLFLVNHRLPCKKIIIYDML